MKNLSVYITIGCIAVGIIGTAYLTRNQVEVNKEDIKEHKLELREHGEQIMIITVSFA